MSILEHKKQYTRFEESKANGLSHTWDTITYGDMMWSIVVFWIFFAKLIYKLSTWLFRAIGKMSQSMMKKAEKMEKVHGKI